MPHQIQKRKGMYNNLHVGVKLEKEWEIYGESGERRKRNRDLWELSKTEYKWDLGVHS